MDYSLIDDFIDHIYSSKRNKFEEDLLVWLVILRTIPMDSPGVELSSLDILGEIINIISHYGDCNPCYELHLFMRKFDHSVYKKDSWIIPGPLFADNYPKTDILGFYDLMFRNMEEFLLMEEDKHESDDLFSKIIQDYFKRIKTGIQKFRPYLKAISDQKEEFLNNETKNIMTWITSLVYEVEYVIDSLLSKQCPRFYSARWLVKVIHRLPGKDTGIEELPYMCSPSMEVGYKESIINYVVSTDRHQIIPILNTNDDNDVGDRLRQVFMDEKIISAFDICRWSFAGLPNSPELMELYVTELREINPKRGDYHQKVVREYSMTLTPQDFKEFLQELLPDRQTYFVIFENLTSKLQFKLLQRMIVEFSSSKASKILYTTREAELALDCRLNSPKVFYIPSKKSNVPSKMDDIPSEIDNTLDAKTEREVVGFSKEKKEMLEQLTKGDVAKCVISISGMAGLGKTTLAKLLFKHPLVTQHFHVRAFCTVSQVYKLRDLLLQLVRQLVPANDAIHGLEDREVAGTVFKSLKGQSYLIVLDDIWDIEAWKAIMTCFPDDKNGSRIIITTRQTDLMPSKRQFVNLLSEDECWQLFKNELFQDQDYQGELTTIGKTIARNCKGLPLSVILIAGFLKKMDKTKAAWEEISESLTPALDIDAEAQRKGIMELSYKHLPDSLKPCLLYFGIFPEDDKIPAEKLIQMWCAEGFLVGDDSKRVEDVAASYLIDLAARSLVTISKTNLSDRVKSCQVHDLIREFCMTKAHEERFFHNLRGYDELLAYSNTTIENNAGFDDDATPSGPRRLAINCQMKQFVETKLSALPLVRSMFFLADKGDMLPNKIYDVSCIYDYFKLLKILDLVEVTIGNSSLSLIFELVLLKYLAIQTDADCIPDNISKLWNLETLILKSSKADGEIQVPDSFWDMTKLRHAHISGKPDFHLDPERVQNTSSAVPNNLQTFSTPSLGTGSNLEKVLARLQSIRKLKCRFSDESLDVAENGQLFPVLDFLSNLESLKVVYSMTRNFEYISGEFKFPDNLTKLSLSNFLMPWEEISQLTKLKVLEVLKIQSRAFKGETWDMSEQDEAFEKLKVLKLDALDIVTWCGVSEEHFPKLKNLILCNLENFEEIPEEIGNINTLEMIDVKWCNFSTEESAKRIKEECDEYGKEINISIHSKAREIGATLDAEMESERDDSSE